MNIMDEFSKQILKNIMRVMKEKKISNAEVIMQLEVFGKKVNRNTFDDWKKDKSRTYIDYIGEIASILGCETDDLSDVQSVKKAHAPSLDESMQNLLFAMYGEPKELTDNQKKDILEFIEYKQKQGEKKE
ncbi:MAG: helix-turn-helix domain-containing protein [Candidatus Dehalobacter alkaniphilus]